jgi:hypothetical protein
MYMCRIGGACSCSVSVQSVRRVLPSVKAHVHKAMLKCTTQRVFTHTTPRCRTHQGDPNFWATKLHFSLASPSFYNYPYAFGYLFSLGVYATREHQVGRLTEVSTLCTHHHEVATGQNTCMLRLQIVATASVRIWLPFSLGVYATREHQLGIRQRWRGRTIDVASYSLLTWVGTQKKKNSRAHTSDPRTRASRSHTHTTHTHTHTLSHTHTTHTHTRGRAPTSTPPTLRCCATPGA